MNDQWWCLATCFVGSPYSRLSVSLWCGVVRDCFNENREIAWPYEPMLKAHAWEKSLEISLVTSGLIFLKNLWASCE